MRHGRVSTSRGSALSTLPCVVRTSPQCARRVYTALRQFPHSKVALHRMSWPVTQQYLCRTICAHLPKLLQQWTTVPSLSDASVWRMLVNDNSLVAWYRIREQCPVAVLSALIAQRKQLPEWYARLVRVTAQELMQTAATPAKQFNCTTEVQ
eukprot:6859-Heterococcus_DN1.PRE.1